MRGYYSFIIVFLGIGDLTRLLSSYRYVTRYVSLLVSEAEVKKLADKTHSYHLLLRLQPYFRSNDEGHVVSLREAMWELRASAVEVDEVLSIYNNILLQYIA